MCCFVRFGKWTYRKKHAFVLLRITSYLFQPPEKQQNQGPARPLRVPPSPTARPRDQPDRPVAGEALRQPAPLGRPPARQVEFCFLFPIARHQPQQPPLKDFSCNGTNCLENAPNISGLPDLYPKCKNRLISWWSETYPASMLCVPGTRSRSCQRMSSPGCRIFRSCKRIIVKIVKKYMNVLKCIFKSQKVRIKSLNFGTFK